MSVFNITWQELTASPALFQKIDPPEYFFPIWDGPFSFLGDAKQICRSSGDLKTFQKCDFKK